MFEARCVGRVPDEIEPVSYTHLDVYKRQLLGRVESLQVSIERLQSLGLTEREAEVMHWVCEGKNNPEICLLYTSRCV